jgi:hypothetical protein
MIKKKIRTINSDYQIIEKKIFNSKIIKISLLLNLFLISSFILLSFNKPLTKKVFFIKDSISIQTDTFEIEVPVIYRAKDLVKLPRDIIKNNSNIPKSTNNPGCIRPGNSKIDKLAIGYIESKNGNFLCFAKKEHGYKALSVWIDEFCKRNPKATVSTLINIYAPSFENDTETYVSKVISKTPLNMYSGVKDIIKHKKELIKIISYIEGFI